MPAVYRFRRRQPCAPVPRPDPWALAHNPLHRKDVMKRIFFHALFGACTVLELAACAGEPVCIDPAKQSPLAVGDTLTLNAGHPEQVDAYEFCGREPHEKWVWRSADTTIAYVTNGVLHGRQSGETEITVRQGRRKASTQVVIAPRVAEVRLSPRDTVVFVGDTLRFIATGYDTAGAAVPGARFDVRTNFDFDSVEDSTEVIRMPSPPGELWLRATIPTQGEVFASMAHLPGARARFEFRARSPR
jgi:hypothetical protein